jgi:DNA-directed RNA polymerase subunit RPC12/RpoP
VVYYDCEHCGSRLFNYEPGEGGKCPNCGAGLFIINQLLVQPSASSVGSSVAMTASTASPFVKIVEAMEWRTQIRNTGRSY